MVTVRDGLDRKDVRRPTPQWYRQAIQRCFTQPEIERLLKKLAPKDKLDILLRTLPKEIINENTGLEVRIILDGIENKRVIQGELVGDKALPKHETE